MLAFYLKIICRSECDLQLDDMNIEASALHNHGTNILDSDLVGSPSGNASKARILPRRSWQRYEDAIMLDRCHSQEFQRFSGSTTTAERLPGGQDFQEILSTCICTVLLRISGSCCALFFGSEEQLL